MRNLSIPLTNDDWRPGGLLMGVVGDLARFHQKPSFPPLGRNGIEREFPDHFTRFIKCYIPPVKTYVTSP